jgi:mRNA-degrading endonuclease toxin of MazEF toxin-antitoxin module
MCDQLRSVSVRRFGAKLGRLSSDDMYETEERLITLLDLSCN